MTNNQRVFLFDSTLRDGAQAEGISFSVLDKLKIVKLLDELGVDYVEAGNPGSNPKDLEFFKEAAASRTAHQPARRLRAASRPPLAAGECPHAG